VAEKWGERTVLVAVDPENKEAIQMYNRLEFSVLLDERELIQRRSNSKPRLFMAKSIYCDVPIESVIKDSSYDDDDNEED